MIIPSTCIEWSANQGKWDQSSRDCIGISDSAGSTLSAFLIDFAACGPFSLQGLRTLCMPTGMQVVQISRTSLCAAWCADLRFS